MDFATMFVVLLFTGGDAEHFIQGQRSMSACQRTVTSQKNGEQTSGSVETDYVLSRVPAGFSKTVRRDHFAQWEASKLALR